MTRCKHGNIDNAQSVCPVCEDDRRRFEPQAEIEMLRARVEDLTALLRELHAMVEGECPSLLDDDLGGCARLGLEIEEVLR